MSTGHKLNKTDESLSLEIHLKCRCLQIQWDLFNPTHQGTREMCRIVQMSEYSGFNLVKRNTLGP